MMLDLRRGGGVKVRQELLHPNGSPNHLIATPVKER